MTSPLYITLQSQTNPWEEALDGSVQVLHFQLHYEAAISNLVIFWNNNKGPEPGEESLPVSGFGSEEVTCDQTLRPRDIVSVIPGGYMFYVSCATQRNLV